MKCEILVAKAITVYDNRSPISQVLTASSGSTPILLDITQTSSLRSTCTRNPNYVERHIHLFNIFMYILVCVLKQRLAFKDNTRTHTLQDI